VYRQETIQLHKIARAPGFRMVLTPHAEKRTKERDIARFELERILKAAPVVMIETDPDGTERWELLGAARMVIALKSSSNRSRQT